MTDDAAALADLLEPARHILLFTGAGISTASGIPDYRGPQGVWNTRRPVEFGDFVRSAEARRRSWQQKLEDHTELAAARPNAAHLAAVRLEQMGRLEMVVTQNVDGLHEIAGTSPARLVEIHGTSRAVECLGCGARSDAGPHLARFADSGEPPLCEDCGGLLKAATISFGQALRPADVQRAMAAADTADLVVALGSSLVVYPAADVPLRAASRGVPYAVVNRGPTDHDRHPALTLRIDDDVNAVFPEAVDRISPAPS